MYSEQTVQQPSTGDVVLITEQFGQNPPGTCGIIYHTEVDKDVIYISVILANGHDIGAFTAVEAAVSLEVVGHYPLDYAYTTPVQLQADFKAGYFDEALQALTQQQ